MKANTFGFYSINGNSTVDFKENSKTGAVCECLHKIRESNPKKRIVMVLDNFSSHKASSTLKTAEELEIDLVFLPPYSPDLNPIEFVWKSIKRVVSREFINDSDHMRSLIINSFLNLTSEISFAKSWISKFIPEGIINEA